MSRFKPDPTDPVANARALTRRQARAKELTRLHDELREARERADQGEQILHAIRRAVGLEFNNGVSLLKFIEERWITDEQIAAAVEDALDPTTAYINAWLEFNKLGIFRCKSCATYKVPPASCPDCHGSGTTRGK